MNQKYDLNRLKFRLTEDHQISFIVYTQSGELILKNWSPNDHLDVISLSAPLYIRFAPQRSKYFLQFLLLHRLRPCHYLLSQSILVLLEFIYVLVKEGSVLNIFSAIEKAFNLRRKLKKNFNDLNIMWNVEISQIFSLSRWQTLEGNHSPHNPSGTCSRLD